MEGKNGKEIGIRLKQIASELMDIASRMTAEAEDIVDVIDKVNAEGSKIEEIADDVARNEGRDKNKAVVLLKAIAVCRLAGISEHKFSEIVRVNPEILKKLGDLNVKSIYHSMRYTSIWKYRHKVYRIFEIKEREEIVACPYCGSRDVIKSGYRKTKKGIKQKYYCKKCYRSFVLKRDKSYTVYDRKLRNKAGEMYCSLGNYILTDGITNMVRNEYKNVEKRMVSRWINGYIRENIDNLSANQKNLIIIKKVIENNGKRINDIMDTIREEWGYNTTYAKIFRLVSAYNRIKENEYKIKEMLNDGMDIKTVSKFIKVPEDMIACWLEAVA